MKLINTVPTKEIIKNVNKSETKYQKREGLLMKQCEWFISLIVQLSADLRRNQVKVIRSDQKRQFWTTKTSSQTVPMMNSIAIMMIYYIKALVFEHVKWFSSYTWKFMKNKQQKLLSQETLQ